MSSAIKRINDICKEALELTDEDLEEAREMARDQMEYFNPLKNATAHWQRQLGDHNMNVVNALRYLRDTIRDGENIGKP